MQVINRILIVSLILLVFSFSNIEAQTNNNSKSGISEKKESKAKVVKFDSGIKHSKYLVSELFGEWGYDETNSNLIICIDSLAFTFDKAQKISFPYKIVYDTITIYQNIDGEFPAGIITLNKNILYIKWINGGGATNKYRKISLR